MAWCWEQGILAQVLADIIGYLPAKLHGFEVQQVEAELTLHLGVSPLLVTGNWTTCCGQLAFVDFKEVLGPRVIRHSLTISCS